MTPIAPCRPGYIIPSDNPQTVADGLLTSLGELTFPIIQGRVEQIVTVSEDAILESMKFIWERAKIIIEPSAAVPVGTAVEAQDRPERPARGGDPLRWQRGSGAAALEKMNA